MNKLLRRRLIDTRFRVRFLTNEGILIEELTQWVTRGEDAVNPGEYSIWNEHYEYVYVWDEEKSKNIQSNIDIWGDLIKERFWLWNPDNPTLSKANWVSGDNTEAVNVASTGYIFGKKGSSASTGTTTNYRVGTNSSYPKDMQSEVKGSTSSANTAGGTSASFRNGWACRTKNQIDFSKWDTFNCTYSWRSTSGNSYASEYFKGIYCVFDSNNDILQIETGEWRGYANNSSIKTFTLADGTTKICRPFQIVNRSTSTVAVTTHTVNYDVSMLLESAYISFVTVIKGMAQTVYHNIKNVYLEKVYIKEEDLNAS